MQFVAIMVVILTSVALGFGVHMLLLPVPMASWLLVQWVLANRSR
jgi:hypothetical protein